MQPGAPFSLGKVLAFDHGNKAVSVAAESGCVAVCIHLPHAHTVAVDRTTHLMYLPLEDVGGKRLPRIMECVSEIAGSRN